MKNYTAYILGLTSLCVAFHASGKTGVSLNEVYQKGVPTPHVQSMAARNTPRPIDDVYNTGGVEQRVGLLRMEPGLYEIGSLHSSKGSKYYMLVETDINNPEMGIKALVIRKDLDDTKRGRAWILNGKPFGNGSSVMLANLTLMNNRFVNEDENVFFDYSILSEGGLTSRREDDTKFILIDKNYGEGKEFMLSGNHPLLQDMDFQNVGMIKSRRKTPTLAHPTYAFFKHQTGRKKKNSESYLAQGNKVVMANKTFRVVSLNGSTGGLYSLEHIKIDTLSKQYMSTGQISDAIAYIKGCWSEDGFVKLIPRMDGSYEAYYFDESHLDSFLTRFYEWLFE